MEVGTKLICKVSGVSGTFVKENVSGHKRVTVIKTFDGREYFAPTKEFKLIEFGVPDSHGDVYMPGCFGDSIGNFENYEITHDDIINAVEVNIQKGYASLKPIPISDKIDISHIQKEMKYLDEQFKSDAEAIMEKYNVEKQTSLSAQYKNNKSIVDKWKEGWYKGLFERFRK